MTHELKQSPVMFDREAHVYKLGSHCLSGVTAIVKWLFPDTYKDIPQSVLNKAAEYGTLVHSKCELYDMAGIGNDIKPVQDYAELKKTYGLQHVCSEYLIDDGENIASSIDKVYATEEENVFNLGDIKTTSKVHLRNVGLQLSIYAMLFEDRNPGKKVGKLLVVWLPKEQYGVADVFTVERLTADACRDIVIGYLNHDDPTPYREKYFGEATASGEVQLKEDALPAELLDAEAKIIELEQTLKQAKEEYDTLKAGMLELMVKNDVKKWQSERLQIVRKLDSTREAVDSTKLKKLFPDVYEQCKKVSAVKGSITIKVL